MKVIRDPVHNIIQFDKDSEKIILDLLYTREFQQTLIPANYLLLRDEATSSSYKDPYISHSPKDREKTPEREATEQIILFDSEGKGEELSNVSEIIGQIRNRDISISNYYVPEQYLKYFCEGVT